MSIIKHCTLVCLFVCLFVCVCLFVEKEILCPDLAAPDNGFVQFSTRVGDDASYRCNDGFQLLGGAKRECQADGTWSGEAPSCIISCPTLSDPVNGMVTQNGTAPGSSACYSCDDGFGLVGCNPTPSGCSPCRTCDANGMWSGMEPECRGME